MKNEKTPEPRKPGGYRTPEELAARHRELSAAFKKAAEDEMTGAGPGS